MSTHLHKDSVSFGIWVYIMSDCVLFASLFAAYAVLHTEIAGGSSALMLFDRSFVLIETLVLLTSSFTCGLAVLYAQRKNLLGLWLSLGATLVLGLTFLAMELGEFTKLIRDGSGPDTSAFLSSYFTLVGTHGLHVFVGALWILVLLVHLVVRGIQKNTASRLLLFSLFWHFLDIVWICIFSLVYLFGSLTP